MKCLYHHFLNSCTLLMIQMAHVRKVRNVWNRLHNVIVHTSWFAFINSGRVRPSMLPSEINSRIENALWGDAFCYDLYPFQARSFLVLGRAFYSRRLFEWGSRFFFVKLRKNLKINNFPKKLKHFLSAEEGG